MTIKRIDATEFREVGFLQEVNRQHLHPLGLALETRSGFTFEDVEALLCNCGESPAPDGSHWPSCPASIPDGTKCATQVLFALGMDREHIGGIWDYRDDPEGMEYGPEMIEAEKAERVATEQARHADARLARFGAVVQAVPGADPVEAEGDIDLHGTFDARVWADRFVRRVAAKPAIATDEGTMLAWFAGAIMAGYHQHERHGTTAHQEADA